MRVPIRWLNDFVKIDDIAIKQLSDLFLSIGFEVEEIVNPSHAYKNIVTGRILDIKKHHKADNLDIVSLDVGKDSPVTIVTGAKNISKNDIVPVALSGAVVSGGKEIFCTDFRGILSEGMLCSGKELDIDDNTISGAEVNGILILSSNTLVGEAIGKALDLDEYIFDISISSNRPDCNSILGLAKEIAVKLDRKISMPQLSYKTIPYNNDESIPNITIADFTHCSRYYGNIIKEVKVKKSPVWMRKRLIAAGIRPINNVVDITNFVLLEVGQPLHAFDFNQIIGNLHIKSPQNNIKFVALNDVEYELNENNLIIADDKNILAIAGVMGGKSSAISDATSTVFLETARFAKTSVRYTSRALGLRSESSARFERGVDYDSVDIGRERALHFFDALGVGKILSKTTFSELPAPKQKVITTSVEQINSILGIKISDKEINRILKSLGFEVNQAGKTHKIECTVPLHREDVDSFADLSEEVIRFYGYDKIKSTNMENASLTRGIVPLKTFNIGKIRSILCAAGLYEILNFSFIPASDCEKLNLDVNDSLMRQIRISNPLGEDRSCMRTQLVSSMIKTLQLNKSRQNESLRLFEIAKTYIPDKMPLSDLPKEPYTLCVGLSGEEFDFYYLKSFINNLFKAFSLDLDIKRSSKKWLHPGISADIFFDGRIVGAFGKLHPVVCKNFETSEDIYILEMQLEDIISLPPHYVQAVPLPKYPAVDRDLAVVVKSEIDAGTVIAAIKSVAGNYLEKVNLFDVYQGGQIEQGYKSMAFSIRFRSQEKTLLDTETQALMQKITEALEKKCEAKLR